MARPTRKLGTKLTRTFSLRLSDDDFGTWMTKVRSSGLSSSEFFRQAVLENQSVIHQIPKLSRDVGKLIYLFAKASNNLNQLAHQANSAANKGDLNHEELMDLLHVLHSLDLNFKQEFAHAD